MTSDYSKITVLVDMDDTIEYLLPAWVSWLNNLYNLNVNYDEISEWDMQKFFPTLSYDKIYAPLFENDFWGTVKPREDAIIYLSKMIELGFNLYICTTSNYKTIRSKLENIIDRHFPFISWEKIITTSNKQLINADILVDDGIHNLIGGSYKKILMSAPHNKDYAANEHGMFRVHNWEEAYEKIIEYSNQIFDVKHGEHINEDN